MVGKPSWYRQPSRGVNFAAARTRAVRGDIRYRNVPEAMVGSYFSTFHGGNSAEWGPQRDSFVRFDAFRIGMSLRAVVGPAAK